MLFMQLEGKHWIAQERTIIRLSLFFPLVCHPLIPLWAAAELRANSKLKSSEYGVPVLGLIFLRYADQEFTLTFSIVAIKLPAVNL